MKSNRRPQVLQEHAAQVFLDRLGDPVTRQLIDIPYREVLRRFRESEDLPVADFDLKFFVEGLFLSCSCHDRIRQYLEGADQRWSPEIDDEIRNATYCPLPTSAALKWKRGPNQYSFSPDLLVRRYEALWLTSWKNDVATIQIVGVALAAFERHMEGKPYPGEPRVPAGCPLAPLDLLFCAEVLLVFAAQGDLLRSVLAAGKQ